MPYPIPHAVAGWIGPVRAFTAKAIRHTTTLSYLLAGFHDDGVNFLNTPLSSSFPVNFGESLTFTMQILPSADIIGVGFRTGGSSSATSDLGGTAYWLGVTEVLGPDGQPVADFTLDSATTGIDWTQSFFPIPEPATFGLGAIGSVMLLVLALQRKRQTGKS